MLGQILRNPTLFCYQNSRFAAWSVGTISRILNNEKCTGEWVLNKPGIRRGPRTRPYKEYNTPESEWIVQIENSLRNVPQNLWN